MLILAFRSGMTLLSFRCFRERAGENIRRRYWQVKSHYRNDFDLLVSRHRPTPLIERTHPEIPAMLSIDIVPANIE
jgi:hypothetical protein